MNTARFLLVAVCVSACGNPAPNDGEEALEGLETPEAFEAALVRPDAGVLTGSTAAPIASGPLPGGCELPEPPTVQFPNVSYVRDEPPTPRGGRLANGRYRPIHVGIYGAPVSTLDVTTLTIQDRKVSVRLVNYGLDKRIALFREQQFGGSHVERGQHLTLATVNCQFDPTFNPKTRRSYDAEFDYSASQVGLTTFERVNDRTTVVTQYVREGVTQ